MQHVAARRVSRRIDPLHGVHDRPQQRRTLRNDCRQLHLELASDDVPFPEGCARVLVARRQRTEARDERLERCTRDEIAALLPQLRESRLKQWYGRTRIERKPVLEVIRGETAGRGLEHDPDLTPVERNAIRIAEDRNQHLAGEVGILRRPIDIEERRVRGRRPVLHHVHPPQIVCPHDRHVIGHDVAQVAHAMPRKRGHESLEIRDAANFRVEHPVVDDVVAVAAPRARTKVGRAVDMAHAESREIRNERGHVVEAEIGVELDPVGRPRDRRERQLHARRSDFVPKAPVAPGPQLRRSGHTGGLARSRATAVATARRRPSRSSASIASGSLRRQFG